MRKPSEQPTGGTSWGIAVVIEGTDTHNQTAAYNLHHRIISPDLFHTMGIPLLHGSVFTWQDDEHGAPVVIVSEETARHFWPQQNALGKRLRAARMDPLAALRHE